MGGFMLSEKEKNELLEKRNKPLHESYYENLQELAKVHPVLAFRLSGKNLTTDFSKRLDERINNISSFLPDAEKFNIGDDENFEEFSGIIKNNLSSDLLEGLEKNIKEVAQKAGRIKFRSIQNDLEQLEKNRQKSMKEYLVNSITEMAENAQQTN